MCPVVRLGGRCVARFTRTITLRHLSRRTLTGFVVSPVGLVSLRLGWFGGGRAGLMRMPSSGQRKLLEVATTNYHDQIMLASSCLQERRLFDPDLLAKWRLGVVDSPEPGHEPYVGRLCIPYQNRSGVVGLKFRCLESHDCRDHGHEKYLALPGQPVFLFNVIGCDSTADTIHVLEGELDTITLDLVFPGEPVVGCPGAGQWQPHWPAHFRSFERVLVWPDGDKAGRNMGDKWRKEIPAAEVVRLPAGMDVNALFVAEGADVFRKLAGAEG